MAGRLRLPAVYIISSLNELSTAVKKCLPDINIVSIIPSKSDEIPQHEEAALLSSAEVLFADLPIISKYMYKAEKLKWAHTTWAGVETIIEHIDAEKPPNAILSRPGTAFSDLMAEFVLGHVLAFEKKIPSLYKHRESKIWDPTEFKDVRLMSSLRLGILGAGQIGTRIGTLCKAVGMEVWGVTREARSHTDDLPLDVYKTSDDLPEVLQRCDYICSVLPSTPATRDLLSGDVLKHCQQRKSVFINIGRGDVINEESLVEALRDGWIGGAVLDVFKTEPLPSDSPLWGFPNVVISPHISGPSQTELVLQSFVENYKKFINSEPLDYVVDWKRGY